MSLHFLCCLIAAFSFCALLPLLSLLRADTYSMREVADANGT